MSDSHNSEPSFCGGAAPDGQCSYAAGGAACLCPARLSLPQMSAAMPGPDASAARRAVHAGVCHSFACAILDALPEQIAVLNEDGIVVAVNAAWRTFARAGQRPGGLALRTDIGTDYRALCRAACGSDAPAIEAALAGVAGVLSGAVPSYTQEYACHSAAQHRWFNMTVTPLSYGHGGVVVARSDITARRQAEADLRIAAIAFESPEGMMVTDAAGKILQVNQAFCNITGYSRQEVMGQRPSLLSSGRHDAAFYRAMWDAIGASGSWEGEIWNRRKNGEVYPERLNIAAVIDQDGSVSHYVASLTDITVSKAASDEIKNLAFYDPLTRLPNRRLLLDRLRQVLAASAGSGRYGALMFIDLDNFKTLNDTLGHNMGDLLLQQVAQRLQGCLRQGDTVARLGGDEFVVLVDSLSGHAPEAAGQTETLASKILAALNQSYALGPHQCHSTPSIGATLFHDGQPPQPEELLMQADIAMYQAKQAGRNGLRFFDQSMHDTISARARLEAQLRQAIEQRQFALYYQIQVDQYGRARGAEALLRWMQPDGSFVSPADFIPLAEESGLILPLGQWVINQACAQLQAWQQQTSTRDLILAVNVSARQFRQHGFCELVHNALRQHGVLPNRLKLELTEGMLLENVEETIATMQALRELGVRFSLDDFGTGYSSLQYLKRLPLDQLKIDQSFVRELVSDSNDQAIVLTIIAMARSLKLDVIAEGVETESQRALLEQLGCVRYQGYLFSRPVPAAAFLALLDAPCAWEGLTRVNPDHFDLHQ
jgi:diguanylate cyclase (GGDEF)-like protein/PAS domain S-box-containing protein